MSNYTINFFGHNNEPGHDKVWGYITVGDGSSAKLYNFWGARGRKIAFKEYPQGWDSLNELRKLARKKEDRGYRSIPVSQIDIIVEGFSESFEKQFAITKLFNNFRGKQAAG